MKPLLASLLAFSLLGSAQAAPLAVLEGAHELVHATAPLEVHQRLVLPEDAGKTVALTLDACGGGFDADLIGFLIESRIPASIFATRKWLDRNPQALALLRAHAELFDIEDHGANHVPAVIGIGRKVYGIPGEASLGALQSEVRDGAAAIQAATGVAPRWYRAATAVYDPAALTAISAMGYKVAGFSVNADAGATLKRGAIIARMKTVKPGDIIIAHMNRPNGDTAEGLSVGLATLQQQGFRFVTLGAMQVRQING
ncbi:MAG TPA: polysaccharide deacetylase family protein [Burkholderiales bacterium]|jgi:peptidoglycan/xylan/chitin deacetylase (PgdA/CDA1 family)|nr:polysaccharide deacetylase family protein [Burkholderiales bacterium]